MLGIVGGITLMAGAYGSFYLKLQMDRAPSAAKAFNLDVGFLFLLFLTSLTGLLLLFLRETSAMGSLLVVHLSMVLSLFIMLPYGKFVHAIYRYAALVRNALEESRKV